MITHTHMHACTHIHNACTQHTIPAMKQKQNRTRQNKGHINQVYNQIMSLNHSEDLPSL